jgi:pimeloyl-ACP methyl ester carboxylesterase
MAGYVNLRGVRTWYDEQGSGEPVVLLHGGLADARFFEHNVGPLAERFHVLATDQRGHGHTADVEGPITFDLMAQDTIAFLETALGRPAHLVGHSNGAFVALLIALRRPELVHRLVLVSGGFHRDGFVRAGDQFDVDAVVAALGRSYGEVSPDGEHLAFVEVRDIAPSTVAIAWRSDNRELALRNFVSLASELSTVSQSGRSIQPVAL